MLAHIFKYFDLPLSDITRLKKWSRQAASFCGFDLQNSDPSLRVATVTNSRGERVALCTIQKCYVVSHFAVSPSASPAEATAAGNCIDAEIECMGQREGIGKALILVQPNHPAASEGNDWQDLKVYERTIPSFAMNGVGLFDAKPVMEFIN